MARARLPEMGRAAILALTNALDQRTNEDTRLPLWNSLFQLDEQLALRRVRTAIERGWTPPSNVVDALVCVAGLTNNRAAFVTTRSWRTLSDGLGGGADQLGSRADAG
jgi:hypothetical protein